MKAVKQEVSFAELEHSILSYWREHNVFQRSLDPMLPTGPASTAAKRPSYVFYDGPTFATGLPPYGHLLSGTFKVVSGRCFTMTG